jgi:hypothetical protein
MVYWLIAVIAITLFCGCSPSKETLEKRLPGTYRFRTSRFSHGADLIILKPDHTYVHLYTPLGSHGHQTQTDHWDVDDQHRLVLHGLIAWELDEWGPRPGEEYKNPQPITLGMPIKSKGHIVSLMVNTDEDESFDSDEEHN